MKRIVFAVLLSAGVAVPTFAQPLYDDLPANASITSPSRKWNKKDLTYYFQNGTADISGTNEYQAVKDGLALWANAADVKFTQVSSASQAGSVAYVVG